jgi:Fic family protein
MVEKKWNWQKADWPVFSYNPVEIGRMERTFCTQTGIFIGVTKHLANDAHEELVVELAGSEAFNTSRIEGEILDRDSLQSSLRKEFGLKSDYHFAVKPAEAGIAEMMKDLYINYDLPLSKEILCEWHDMLMNGRRDIERGTYRTCKEAMQVVSGRYDKPTVHYEAPPSPRVHSEMKRFIKWFNDTAPGGSKALPALIRAGIAHLYFVSIHPFEDGNGRIGRAIVTKSLSQNTHQAILIALSATINDKKRDYYNSLGENSTTNEITKWIVYFGKTIITAQENTIRQIDFILNKAKFFDIHRETLNPRQLKVINRIFKEGPEGFQGGLSARNYKSITKTSDATVTRDLQDLVAKGIFFKTGQFKNARYALIPEIKTIKQGK